MALGKEKSGDVVRVLTPLLTTFSFLLGLWVLHQYNHGLVDSFLALS